MVVCRPEVKDDDFTMMTYHWNNETRLQGIFSSKNPLFFDICKV